MKQEMKKKYEKPAVNVIHANCGGFMAETFSTVNSSDTNGNSVDTGISGTTQGGSDDTDNTSKGHTILWDEEEE